jgi:hypothetical protein
MPTDEKYNLDDMEESVLEKMPKMAINLKMDDCNWLIILENGFNFLGDSFSRKDNYSVYDFSPLFPETTELAKMKFLGFEGNLALQTTSKQLYFLDIGHSKT